MKLSEQLRQDHECGDFGKALEGYAERAGALEAELFKQSDFYRINPSWCARDTKCEADPIYPCLSGMNCTSKIDQKIKDEVKDIIDKLRDGDIGEGMRNKLCNDISFYLEIQAERLKIKETQSEDSKMLDLMQKRLLAGDIRIEPIDENKILLCLCYKNHIRHESDNIRDLIKQAMKGDE